MTKFVRACSLDEVMEGRITRVELGEKILALYKIEGQYFATDAICTHAQVDLGLEGELQGDIVECPAHFGQFHIPTGAPVARPCLIPLKTYKVEVRENELMVESD